MSIDSIDPNGSLNSPSNHCAWKKIQPTTNALSDFQVSAVGKMIIGYAVMQKIGTRRDRYTYSQTFDPFDVSTIGHRTVFFYLQ